MVALGKVCSAALYSDPKDLRRKDGLEVSLSLIPKDNIIKVVVGEVGVLFLRMCVACAIFAPGKLSTWTLTSGMRGSLDRFESPMIISGLRGSNVQLLCLSLLCGWCV